MSDLKVEVKMIDLEVECSFESETTCHVQVTTWEEGQQRTCLYTRPAAQVTAALRVVVDWEGKADPMTYALAELAMPDEFGFRWIP